MCIICDKEYNDNTEFIECCEDVKKIPKTLINLKELYGNETQIKKIPKELINLEILYFDYTQIKKIPKTLINLILLDCNNKIKKIPKELINLKTLYCTNTQIKKIPKTLTKLKLLRVRNTQIKFIPDTLINLEWLICDANVLVSPQTYKLKSNNKKYLTFTRCQAKYKHKLRLRKLKFAYDPKYIIGHTTKKQLVKLFQN
jgi:Leucine-rich repeat (LRR) protein